MENKEDKSVDNIGPEASPNAMPGKDDPTFIPGDLTTLLEIPRELGIYRLKRQLGRGGMGEVWLAFDTTLERDVAVKLMRKELLANDEAVRRFMREARAVARLNHPNIVQVYSFGDQTGLLYFVMELVEGQTLADRIRATRMLPLEEAVPFMLQTIEGLSYANARGIIHRDIKPSNLMLTSDLRVKIADFGLAKMVEHDSQMTAAGATMGSPNYMSPEQARGTEADHRSDIYALGISFYQALTGELPFNAQSPLSVLLRQIQDPLPQHPVIGALADGKALEVLMKMTDKDPDRRYQNYGEVATAMAQLMPNQRFRGSHFVTGTMPATSPGAAARTLTPPGTPMAGLNGPGPKLSLPPIPTGTSKSGSLKPALPEMVPEPPGQRKIESPSNRSTAVILVGFVVLAAVAIGAYFWYANTNAKSNSAGGGGSIATIETGQGNAVTHSANIGEKPVAVSASVATPLATESETVAVSAQSSSPVTPRASIPSNVPVTGMVIPTLSTKAVVTPVIVTPPPVPIPQHLVTVDHVIIGSDLDAPGVPVPVTNAQGISIGTVAAGTQANLIRSETRNGKTEYVIVYGQGEGYVDYDRARMALKGSPMATALNSGVTPASAAQVFILGTQGAGPNEMVPVFMDEKARIEFKRVPAGTSVYLVEEEANTYKVALPEGKQVYIFKKMAKPKK